MRKISRQPVPEQVGADQRATDDRAEHGAEPDHRAEHAEALASSSVENDRVDDAEALGDHQRRGQAALQSGGSTISMLGVRRERR